MTPATEPFENASQSVDVGDSQTQASHQGQAAMESSRRELVAFLCHDLRTPLAGLRALAEGLEDDVMPDPRLALGRMRSTIERMSAMVDDLFELSRLTSGVPGRRVARLSLTELALDVVALLDGQAKARQISLTIRSPEHDPVKMLGCFDELFRALTNLLANGIRHTPCGGAVTVEVGRSADGGVMCTVTDGCGGIAEQDLPRLFDLGWRGGIPSPLNETGRAGFGLAIARGVVEAHAGTIVVANTASGCRFELVLPAGLTAAS